VSKTLTLIAVAMGIVAASAGSAFAGGACSPTSGTQSVSLETQTASTGGTNAPYTPMPETNSN
jgi:hypothetical protein